MPFKPGISGNPGGRPKGNAEIARLARQHTESALDTLAEICKDGAAPPSARVSAAVALLDRGYGKAPQEITINDESSVAELSDRDLNKALVSELAHFVASLDSGNDQTQH